jgi:hypothetical protein
MLQLTKNYKKFHLFNKWKGMDFKRAKIVACATRPNYRVWISFDDGLKGEVDLSDLVGQGVFEAWKSVEFFNEVRVDPMTDTLAWGDSIDLDPYALREWIELDWIDVDDRKPPPNEEVFVRNSDNIIGKGHFRNGIWECDLPNVTQWKFKYQIWNEKIRFQS